MLGTGLLVGGDTYAYQLAPPDMVEKAQKWGALCERHNVSLPATAVAFAAMPTCVSRVVLGMATEEELEQNLRTVEESAAVPVALFHEAQQAGLLLEDIPLPS